MTNRINRINYVAVCFLLCALAILIRLFYMQIICWEEYSQAAKANMIHPDFSSPPRGVIFDCNGTVLARNTARFSVQMLPNETEEPLETLELLSKLLNLPKAKVDKLKQQLVAFPSEPIILLEALDDVSLAKFAEIQDNTKGVYLDVKPLRDYPLGEIASHVLGYVGEIDENSLKELKAKGYAAGEWVGQDGIELYYDRKLHGHPGVEEIEIDVNGDQVQREVKYNCRPGLDLYLSIDAQLQKVAEEALGTTLNNLSAANGERSGGALVAVETSTGYVRALVSLPDYNPNWFAKGISKGRFSSLINDPLAPLLNRAVSGAYPPGSTFKLVTTAAALEEGVITPNSSFYCSGVQYVAGLPFNCFVRSGHGPLNLIDCLAYSCDVAYYQMGTALKIGKMKKYAKMFNVGEKTGIDLPGETAGNFPTAKWKEDNLKEEWFPGDDANTAIGQGFVAATPIQLALVTAAVANGGYVFKPQLLERIGYNNTGDLAHARVNPPVLLRKLPIKESYFSPIRLGMVGAVSHGTAAGSSYVDMAGKTGTAENSPSALNIYGRNHAWFTGFTPVNGPELAITVFLEKSGGYGGSLAAPIAFKVADKWKKIQHPELKMESRY